VCGIESYIAIYTVNIMQIGLLVNMGENLMVLLGKVESKADYIIVVIV